IVKGLEGFESNFTPIKNEADKYDMVENKETRRAFTEGYVSDAFIYLAFSGKKSIDPESYKTDIILKYDWNGTPVKKIKLDRPILNFTILKDKLLYAFDPKTGYIVKSNI